MKLDLGQAVKEAVKEAVREVLQEMRDSGAFELGRAAEPKVDGALLTVKQVAERCGDTTVGTVLAWIHAGKLAASRPGHVYLVSPDDLQRFLDGQRADVKQAVDSDVHLNKVLTRMSKARSR